MLQEKIRSLSREIYEEMQQWKVRLIDAGVDKAEAGEWAACCDEIIDECRRSLIALVDTFDESDTERIPQLLLNKVVYGVLEVSIPEMQQGMNFLEEALKKHLPPEEFDDEDESAQPGH